MSHRWTFFRAGGFDQVRFMSAEDLAAIDQLDQKLWAALACPTRGTEFDTRTLDLLDTDKNGRVHSPEVVAAVKWTVSVLKEPAEILKNPEFLQLSAINDATPEGKQVLASARQILINIGKPDATSVSVEDTGDLSKIFAPGKFNGDGIVTPALASDAALAAVINDIITCLGSEADRSGQPGIGQAKADQFFADCQAFADWSKKAESDAAVLPLGVGTAGAVGAVEAVKGKVDDYFARVRLAAFDSRALTALNRQESEYLAVSAKDMSITADEITGFPLARVEAGKPLPLKDGLNPAWAGAMAKFNSEVVQPILGARTSLTEADWAAIHGKLAPYLAWAGSKAGLSVERLGLARVQEILSGSTRQGITSLIAKDREVEAESNSIVSVDRLVRFHRYLGLLLRNFVSFEDFYSRKRKATFQAGTLYLDGRSCDLCVTVHDAGKHAALAGLAKTYLAYCDCNRPGGEKMTIAAAFTAGDADNLMVGRNGLFYDRKGRDWDATITKVIENPISVRQAFWAPYKKLVRMIEEQVAKRAAAAEAESDKRLAAAASSAATADKAKPEQKKVDVGTVAALGVAVGAIGTAFAAFAGYFAGVLKLPFWQVCLAFVGLLLVISGPSMLIAWLKLRQRNLGPILDANGWAINGRVRMNVTFGRSLTAIAALPEGARAVADDPFAERPPTWPKFVLFVVIICFIYSLLNQFGVIATLKEKIGMKRSMTVETTNAPAAAITVDTNAAPAK